ncbi:MAG: tripartite tricarboxylate transporter substrate binding protein [Betaproteobacteria bacterium]|nr:tripartite tricarboxylate transporter substrate binding protein [Betaproteobacteria bacterium]NBY04559.1 tripartite tricarboxylate transporter substrate binding protein [Betaproteobacteria bacterium]
MIEKTLRKVPCNILTALLLAACMAQSALAQTDTFPTKPIRIIASTSPGGLTDLLARNLARLMSDSLSQQVVVENRPGAGTLIGMTACARAIPDGYTLCLTDNQSLVFNPLLFNKLPYDPKGDFVAIGGVVRTPNDVIVATPTLPANNLAEVLALARAKPGALSFATWGPGSLPAIYYAWITRQAGVQMTPVPYKGAGPSFLAVMTGEVNLAYSSLAIAKPAAEAGKVKLIAVTGNRRAVGFPNTASLGESNSDPNLGTFWGLYAPAKTPNAVVARLNAELNKALSSPSFQGFAQQGFLETIPGTPEQFTATLTQAQATSARTFQTIGIQPTDAPADAPQAAPRP